MRSGQKRAAKKGLLGPAVRYAVADASACLDLARLGDFDDVDHDDRGGERDAADDTAGDTADDEDLPVPS